MARGALMGQIRTKPSTDTYRENYDRIFGPKPKP
jgi:hypothetical protein